MRPVRFNNCSGNRHGRVTILQRSLNFPTVDDHLVTDRTRSGYRYMNIHSLVWCYCMAVYVVVVVVNYDVLFVV